MRHVVRSILIIKYRLWCTLTFQKCVKKGKLCQNATLNHKSTVYFHLRNPWSTGRRALQMHPVSGPYSCRSKPCPVRSTCIDLGGNMSRCDPLRMYKDDKLVLYVCRVYFAKMKSNDHKLNALLPNGRSVPYALRL